MGEQKIHVDLKSIIDRYQVVDQRKYQIDCIEEIVGHVNNGNDVLIDLPTGTGKTLIYSPIIAEVSEEGGSVLVLTATKQAQRRVGGEIKRFERDGKHVLVYGIGEYNCPLSGGKAQHWDCNELKEEVCKLQNMDCDVINSEKNFLSSNLVITNFSKFLLSLTNRDFDIIVLDDSHGFENTKDQIHQMTVLFGEARILHEKRILSEPLQKMLENFLNLFSEIFERCVNPLDYEGVITPEYLIQLAGIIEDDAEQQIKDEINDLPYSDTRSLCSKIYYFVRRCKASSKHQFYIRKDYYNREDWDSSELISRRDDIIDFIIRNCFRKSRVIFVTATPGNAKLHAKSCTLRNYTESGLGEVPSENINSPEIDNWFKRLKIIVTEDIGDTRQHNPFEKAVKLTTEILKARRERALVLFKNYRDQRTAYKLLSKIFTPEKLFFIDPTSQNADIVEEFADKSQISLASASSTLWEGINIKNLRLTIIITPPFIRPNVGKKKDYPYFERRMLVRLQQGIGRIIRSPKDFGVAVLTDSRFVKYVNRKAFSQRLRAHVDLLESSNILPTISELFESWS